MNFFITVESTRKSDQIFDGTGRGSMSGNGCISAIVINHILIDDQIWVD